MKHYFYDLIRHYLPAVIAGALVSVAFPPYPFGFAAYFGLIPLLYWSRTGTLKQAFKTGYWWGFGFHTAGLYWIIIGTALGGVMSLLYLPLYSGVTLLLFRWLYKRYGMLFFIMFPFIWTAIEYLRGLGVLGFPWMSIAYTQSYYPVLIQYIEYTGVYGVTFWICSINVVLFLLFDHFRKRKLYLNVRGLVREKRVLYYFVILIALIISPWIYGRSVMKSGKWIQNDVTVSLIQGNVDMNDKANAELLDPSFRLYEKLSLIAAQDNPDLIVWPETAAVTYLKLYEKYDRWMRRILVETNTPILTGSIDYVPEEINGVRTFKTYNAAVFFQNELSEGVWYGKSKLVPFGEWFPYEDRFPILRNLNFGQGSFTPGRKFTILSLYRNKLGDTLAEMSPENGENEPVNYAVSICFESVFPDFIQKFTKKGAQFLVVITNNNWFGNTSSSYQHAQFSVFRAIENRLGIAHCSNSGISILIDPYGRVTDKSGVFVEDILTGKVNYRGQDVTPPFYTRNGDKFSQSVLAVSLLMFVVGFFRKKNPEVV